MRIIVIGAVAGGTSAATKAKRDLPEAEVILYEKGKYISYVSCGIPYYLGEKISDWRALAPRDAAYFEEEYGVAVHTEHEITKIDPTKKSVTVKNLQSGEIFTEHYDKLLIATGARATLPPIKNIHQPHVFTLRSLADMFRIENFLKSNDVRKVVVIGSGFIGMEMAENFLALGKEVTILERAPQVFPGLDADMAALVEEHVREKGVEVVLEAAIQELTKDAVIMEDGAAYSADFVLVAAGIRPNTEIAEAAGIELGVAQAIKVDGQLRTNIDDIYACGDCMLHFHAITQEPVYRPLGSTANKTGRIAGINLVGGKETFKGIMGTGAFRVFDRSVAMTGLSEQQAREKGYDVEVALYDQLNKPAFMGGEAMRIKAIADRATGRLIGAQIVGGEGVDKRIDVLMTFMTHGGLATDLVHLDLAYTPPYNNSRDPVMYAGMILEKKLSDTSNG